MPPSDDEQINDLNEQIQLVNQIQQNLLTEQKKLEMMMKGLHRESVKRKIPVLTTESLMKPLKHIRIRSPSSINRILVENKSYFDTEDTHSDTETITTNCEHSHFLSVASSPIVTKLQQNNQGIEKMVIPKLQIISTAIQNVPSSFPSPPPPIQQTTQHIPCKISPSDYKLHKDMNHQIQIVNKIKQNLLNEQKKLEIILKEFHTRNDKMMTAAKEPSVKMQTEGQSDDNTQNKRTRRMFKIFIQLSSCCI